MPQKRLDKANLAKLTAKGGPVIYWDRTVTGLGLKVRPSGRRTWVVRVGGRQHRTHTLPTWPEMSFEEAKARALQIQGEEPSVPAATGPATWSDVIADFKRRHVTKVKRRPVTDDRNALKRLEIIEEAWGTRRPRQLTEDDVRALLKPWVEDGKPYAANRLRAQVRQLWEWARRKLQLVNGLNPASEVPPQPEEKRYRPLPKDEAQRLRVAVMAYPDVTARNAIRFLWATGARVGEGLGLRWDNVNSEACWVDGANTKTGKRSVYGRVGEVARVLDEQARQRVNGHPFVFPSPKLTAAPLESVRKPWAAILADADVTGLQLKDLRHARATDAARRSGSLEAVRKLLGHSDIRTTQRYLDLVDDDVTALLELPLVGD